MNACLPGASALEFTNRHWTITPIRLSLSCKSSIVLRSFMCVGNLSLGNIRGGRSYGSLLWMYGCVGCSGRAWYRMDGGKRGDVGGGMRSCVVDHLIYKVSGGD